MTFLHDCFIPGICLHIRLNAQKLPHRIFVNVVHVRVLYGIWNKVSVDFIRYGVKINWICDAENGYALKGLLYIGRSSEEPQLV
ncbi:hypothetical protein T02_6022 [Trichinella nativa]|uniref:Uncharacterized protein n=1 Tax=Trichinella nativa TaxID=6335 RepID=A0A0V1KJP6_9BILA|nr:hypothetical protein T02_6022 [Trichinella nativa]